MRCLSALTATFQPTPSARRVTYEDDIAGAMDAISTHTLRKEGDLSSGFTSTWLSRFQPTPSARRVTLEAQYSRDTKR